MVTFPGRTRETVPYLLLLLVFIALYAIVMQVGFLSDDFLDLHHTFGPESFSRLEIGGFRPLSVAVYSFDALLYGPTRAWGWHLTNLLLHMVCTFLMWMFLRELGFRGIALFAGVALFMLSAAGPPAVARMSGRTTVISILPLLAALISHVKWMKTGSGRYLILSNVLFLLSLLAKETALLAPFVFAGVSLYVRDPSKIRDALRDCIRILLLYFIPVAVYLIWRAAFGILTVHYDESLHFGFYMAKNVITLSSMSWSPWIANLPVRIQFLTLIFLLLLPLEKRVKILYVIMTLFLLLTVSNLAPRTNYAYAALPAASFLAASVLSGLSRRTALIVLVPFLLACALSARDGISRVYQASSYVRSLTGQLIGMDGSIRNEDPVFVGGIRYQMAGYGTVWPGALDPLFQAAGYVPGREIFEQDGFWEHVHSISEDFSGVSCWFVQLEDEGYEARDFSTDSRTWTTENRRMEAVFSDGTVCVDSNLHSFNSLVIPRGNVTGVYVPDPWDRYHYVKLLPVCVSADSTWFDLERSIPWLVAEPPFDIGTCGYDGPVVFSGRRFWREELERRIRQKQEITGGE